MRIFGETSLEVAYSQTIVVIFYTAVARRSSKHRIDEENQDEQYQSSIYIAGATVLHRSGMFAWKRELHRTTNVSLCPFLHS